ncbi:MAG: DUF5371 family protein [Methanomicrobia archaeon]|nr:DUF5371 family protein [Methanomicrobia archaeon]
MVREESAGIVFAQVPLLKSQLEALKRRSDTTTTKDALQAAVTHYLNCPALQQQGPTGGEEGTAGARTAPPRKREEKEEEKDWWWSPGEKAER